MDDVNFIYTLERRWHMRHMRLTAGLLAMTFSCFIPWCGMCAQSLNIIHSFAGALSDGQRPMGQGLITDGSKLYGMTQEGGSGDTAQGWGTIFSLKPDGSDYSVLHSFHPAGTQYDDDGRLPFGGLTLDSINNRLYGMACYGGFADKGMIFFVNIGDSGYGYLYDFGDTPANPGLGPEGSLLLSGGKLYGMTRYGGANHVGVVFSKTTGEVSTGCTSLHSFAGKPGDGMSPFGSLILDGGKFYGMTHEGGTGPGVWGSGVIFSMNVDGSGHTILHNFTGEPSDGVGADGTLVMDSGTQTLYGVTNTGGSSSKGTIFSIGTNGANYQILHSFIGEPGDGENPGDVLLKGGTLYGLTGTGGSTEGGTLYSIQTDGSGYTILHNFNDSQRDGPVGFAGPLLSIGNNLYGMTYSGGTFYNGTVFSFGLSAPQAEMLLSGSSLKAGDHFEATFQLNESIERPFTAFAIIILPGGSMLNALTLTPKLAPVAANVPRLNAPFNFRLIFTTISGGAPIGAYEVVAAFFDSQTRITGRQDAFLEASGRFTIGQ